MKIAQIMMIMFGLLFGMLFLGGCWVYQGYDKAVTLDEAVNANWAEVDNQLKRRADLIDNLVGVVKGITGHESDVFINIAKARKGYFAASTMSEKVQGARVMTAAMGGLLGLQEKYPELRSNKNFTALQAQVEGTENRLAVSRMNYNRAVGTLNTYTRRLFGRFCSGLAGVEKAEFFKVAESDKAAPKIDFSKDSPAPAQQP